MVLETCLLGGGGGVAGERIHHAASSKCRGAPARSCGLAGRAAASKPAAGREDAYRANNLGVAYLEQYNYEQAAASFRRALEIDGGLTLAASIWRSRCSTCPITRRPRTKRPLRCNSSRRAAGALRARPGCAFGKSPRGWHRRVQTRARRRSARRRRARQYGAAADAEPPVRGSGGAVSHGSRGRAVSRDGDL